MSKIETLRQALLGLYHEHRESGAIPTTARFLFYELVQRGIIAKERKPAQPGKRGRRADQDMSDALTDLRERGQIPWTAIVDETREVEDFSGAASVKQWVLDVLPVVNLDPWQGRPPMVLCESRSLAGALRPIAREYGVKLAATNGQCGGFLRTDIAPQLKEDDHVLYFGDLDLAGGDIEGNTKRVLERIVGPLRWERLALTAQQVEAYNLPKIIKHDRRFKDGGAHEAVETEALSQTVIMDILRTRLEELLPEPLEAVQERAKREQEALAAHVRRFRG